MAVTEYVFITGKLSWVKTTAPNEWGKWTATIHPNDAGLEKIREMQTQGLKNVLKKDDDGYHCTFSRSTQMMAKGKVIGLTPPEVLQADGKTPLTGVLVGNGSDGTIKLEWYINKIPGKLWARARLLSIKVDNLIPFELKRDFSEGQQQAVAGLAEQKPEQLF